MKKSPRANKLLRFFRLAYLELFRIHDTSQRVALGLGLGVFLGILPGTGPLAALFLALLLRVNRASALLGSLLTNTWLSIVTVVLAVKAGSCIMGVQWQSVYTDWLVFLRNFHWTDVFKAPILGIILPVIIGYFVVAFSLGLVVYLMALVVLKNIKHENKSRTDVSG